MGDSTIMVAISNTLLQSSPPSLSRSFHTVNESSATVNDEVSTGDDVVNSMKNDGKFCVIPSYSNTRIRLSADSTLRDVVDCIHKNILAKRDRTSIPISSCSSSTSNANNCCIAGNGDGDATTMTCLGVVMFDCTYHPPKRLTYNKSNDQKVGKDSITLQSLGWWPGGKLVVVHALEADVCLDALLSNLPFVELYDKEWGRNGEDPVSIRRGDYDEGGGAGGGTTNRVLWKGISKAGQAPGVDQGSHTPLPSQVFGAVARRFDEDDEAAGAGKGASGTADTNANAVTAKSAWRTEQDRCAKLDATIRALDEKGRSCGGKNKSISVKVRRMLIKSRSKGDKLLREEDRFYLEVVVILDKEQSETMAEQDLSSLHYMHFSRLATAGRVATACVPKEKRGSPSGLTAELLVKRSPTSMCASDGEDDRGSNHDQPAEQYWRIPNLMPLHDAESRGFLSQFEQVVVRMYDNAASNTHGRRGDATPLILELLPAGQKERAKASIGEMMNAEMEDGDGDAAMQQPLKSSLAVGRGKVEAGMFFADDDKDEGEERRNLRISGAIDSLDADQAKSGRAKASITKKKKKLVASKTLEKVRQMQIKSRARGDDRVRLDDRFYLDIVMVEDFAGNSAYASSSFHFFPNRADASDVVKAALKSSSASGAKALLVELLVESPALAAIPVKENGGRIISGSVDQEFPMRYMKVPDEMRLCDLEARGLLKQFGRVVVRRFSEDSNDAMKRTISVQCRSVNTLRDLNPKIA